jgi:hypothetical protein
MARKLLGIYLVTRTDDVDYEDNDAVVVIAANADDAREFAANAPGSRAGNSAWHLSATNVILVGKALSDAQGGVILVSNRGA